MSRFRGGCVQVQRFMGLPGAQCYDQRQRYTSSLPWVIQHGVMEKQHRAVKNGTEMTPSGKKLDAEGHINRTQQWSPLALLHSLINDTN